MERRIKVVAFCGVWMLLGLWVRPALSAEQNLVPNPSFEIDADGDEWPDFWVKDVKRGMPSVTMDKEVAHSGSNSLKFDRIDRDLVYVRQSGIPVRFKAGEVIDFRFWLKTEGLRESKNLTVFLSFADHNGKELAITTGGDPDNPHRVSLHGKDGTSDWMAVEKKGVIVPEGAYTATIYICASWIYGTFWIDDIEVVRNN